MGQTRVDLRHLLEDLRDAYPGEIEETILVEIVANALDSGASSIRVLADPGEPTIVVVDDGSGMGRRQLTRYHDLASSSKTRGDGIGFAGVGIKLGLLVSDAVLTETRRGTTHIATRWHLASRQRAPWHWAPPPGWVAEQGTAVGLHLRNALSPLLDAGYLEATLRLHYEALLDPAFDEILAPHYPRGVTFAVNGRTIERAGRPADRDRAVLVVKLPRKRKPSAVGFLRRSDEPLAEDRQGVAVSTLGKVIRRGWDWAGLSPTSPRLVGGLIEAPGLATALTLNKGDFIRSGKRGVTYLSFRKAIQSAVQSQLAAWGEAREREDRARRRTARPIERDLEEVLVELAEDFPALSALVERRPGGQRRLPTGGDLPRASGPARGAAGGSEEEAAARGRGANGGGDRPELGEEAAVEGGGPAGEPVAEGRSPAVATGTLSPPVVAGPRKPARYGLAIEFEDRPESSQLGRLVESTVLVNTAHAAYRRAVASRSEGYHTALCVGMALAAVAVEPPRVQAFLSTFLARWGGALDRDRRRRTKRPAHGRGS